MASSEKDKKGKSPATPHKKDPPEVHSTPLGKGTASDALFKFDERVTVGGNPTLIDEDLQGTQTVPLITMLRAMIMKKRVVEGGNALTEVELEQHGRTELQALLQASVDYCNGAHSKKLKGKVATMLKCDTESDRYLPLAIGLNSILLDFRKTAVGTLGVPDEGEEVIYAVNDPTIIVSKPISEDAEGTRTKPDICLFKFGSYCQLVAKATPNPTPDMIAGLMEHKDGPSQLLKKDSTTKLGWSDIVSCIELKRYKEWSLTPPRLNNKYDVNSMTVTENQPLPEMNLATEILQKEPGSSAPHGGRVVSSTAKAGLAKELAAPPKATSSRKRRADSERLVEPPTSAKKLRMSSTNPGESGKLRPDAQCAVYGIELLRSRWDKTHSIVVLFRDNLLSLRWYDSQGCISTRDIDIIEHLPLLVAVVVLMQRFKAPMQGLLNMDLKATIDDKEIPFAVPDDTHTRWELKGRRPATGIPKSKKRTHCPDAPVTRANSDLGERDETAGELDDMFFKWSWREETRDSEHAIIATAKERARQYLPEDHVGDVLNHLPNVRYAQDFEAHSTAHIRKYAGIPTSGARIPGMILFKRLRSIDKVEMKDLVNKIWDVIRCSWLLWAIGVAHGDISYWNIMSDPVTDKLILNDFDLATIMEPGDQSPSKKGFERTGTKPFMALALMERPGGTLKRLWRHELESFIWIFAWRLEGDKSQERWTWNHPSFRQAAQNKRSYWSTNLVMPTEHPETIEPNDMAFWAPLCLIRYHWNALVDAEYFLSRTASTSDCVAIFEKGYPRGDEYKTWDWVSFKVATVPRT